MKCKYCNSPLTNSSKHSHRCSENRNNDSDFMTGVAVGIAAGLLDTPSYDSGSLFDSSPSDPSPSFDSSNFDGGGGGSFDGGGASGSW